MTPTNTARVASSKVRSVLAGVVAGSLLAVGAASGVASAAPPPGPIDVVQMPDGPLCPLYPYMLLIQRDYIGAAPDVATFSRQIFRCEQERPGS